MAPGTAPALCVHVLGCLHCLATPAVDSQAVAVCDVLVAAKPPLVPWLLKHLDKLEAPGLVAGTLGGFLKFQTLL